MGRITVVKAADLTVRSGRELLPGDRHHLLTDEELDSEHAVYLPQSDESLSLVKTTFMPDTVVRPHAHDVSEVVVVIAGGLRSGAHELGPGDALYVEAHTLYGFTVGSEGCTFVNFRATESQYLSKQQFLARRTTARANQKEHR